MPQERRRRARTTTLTETSVLVGTRRRCAFCYGLHGDLSLKAGQLAHVDRDRSNSSETNLAFLCLEHHDQYDSKTSQSKGLTADELRTYRAALEDAIPGAQNSPIDLRDLPVSPPPAAAYRLVDDSLFIPIGHVSPYFATDGDVTCELADVRVLIVAGTLRDMRKLLPMFERAARGSEPLLVVADGFNEETLSTMVVNTQKRVLRACAIALAEASRQDTRRAIARFSAATVFGDEAGRAIENATLGDLGRLASFRADLTSTILKKVVQPRVSSRADKKHEAAGSNSNLATRPGHDEALSPKAVVLLRESAATHDGLLLRIRTMNGLRILTNAKEFSEAEAPAVQADWDEAIALLLNRGLISGDERGKEFYITAAGHRVANTR